MATITKKNKKGRTYYCAVESARVDGKPRIVWQKYLGTMAHRKDHVALSRMNPRQRRLADCLGIGLVLRG